MDDRVEVTNKLLHTYLLVSLRCSFAAFVISPFGMDDGVLATIQCVCVCSNPLWIKVGSKSAKNQVLWVQLIPIAIIIRNIQFSPSIALTLVLLKLLRPIQYLYLGKLDSPRRVVYHYSWYYAQYQSSLSISVVEFWVIQQVVCSAQQVVNSRQYLVCIFSNIKHILGTTYYILGYYILPTRLPKTPGHL